MKLASAFDVLNAVNVNDKTSTKSTGGTDLTYLSWADAWSEVKKVYPDATYTIWKDENNLPYVYDPKTGYMVYVSVTIDGITHEAWLPVMDGANRAMKAEPYEIATKYKTITVAAATMMDINKAIMRAFTKAIALHGLGLYIYRGEDITDAEVEANKKSEEEAKKLLEAKKRVKEEGNKLIKLGVDKEQLFEAVAKHNDGSRDMNEIKSVDVCEKIIEELKTIKPASKKKTSDKQ